jgi:hypothetical protein
MAIKIVRIERVKLFLICTWVLLSISTMYAQKHDFVWRFGEQTDQPQDSTYGWGIQELNFLTQDGNPILRYVGYDMKIAFSFFTLNYADQDGQYRFSYNGNFIEDASAQTMLNGHTLNDYFIDEPYRGDQMTQSSVALPWPGESYFSALIHQERAYGTGENLVFSHRLFLSKIDLLANNGLGAVVERKQLFDKDTFDLGRFTACRHANGRDWWFMICGGHSKNIHTYLLDDKGIEKQSMQILPETLRSGGGTASFSTDGRYYARAIKNKLEDSVTVTLMQFDRCVGTFTFLKTLVTPNVEYGTSKPGVAFSPDNRYLYITHQRVLFQVDMEDPEYTLDSIAEWDGNIYLHPEDGFQVGSYFGYLSSGPDGRIYSVTGHNTIRQLHVIDKPNRRGVAADVRQHAINTPTAFASIPLFPSYRLGPIDGSPCDTLGIDNIPQAYFRYEKAEDRVVFFTDLSSYEPTRWAWDFGDGNIAWGKDHTHIYDAPGIYEACLTVSNENGAHTFCRIVDLSQEDTKTSTDDLSSTMRLKVYPNPATEYVHFEWDMLSQPNQPIRVSMYNMQGMQVDAFAIQDRAINQIVYPVTSLLPGMYVVHLSDGADIRFVKKFQVR